MAKSWQDESYVWLSVPHTCNGRDRVQQSSEEDSPPGGVLICTHAVKVVHTGGTLGRLLTHTPRLIVGIQLARLPTFTGEVGARIWRKMKTTAMRLELCSDCVAQESNYRLITG